jgi:hypothetical protein
MKNIQNKITDNGVANGLDWSIVSIPSSLDYVQVAYSLVSINEGSTNVVKSGNITFTTIAELEEIIVDGTIVISEITEKIAETLGVVLIN